MFKKLRQEITKQTVNSDGELIEETSLKSFNVHREPDFIKLYTADLLRIKDIPKGMNGVLIFLLKKMNYQNEVYVISHVKKEMELELGIKDITIKKSLEEFVCKKILTRKHKGVYIFDPFLFGRGAWEDVRKLRLTITYESGKAEKTIDAQFE
jgi:hypothetical protein